MSRSLTVLALLGTALFASAPSYAQRCTRADLQAAVDSYLNAQTKGDPSLLTLAPRAKYVENRKQMSPKSGVLGTPEEIDFHRSLLDTDSCQTFTEAIIALAKHPYVIGTALTVSRGKVSKVDSLVTDNGDWLFSARRDLELAPTQDWDVIKAPQRDSRKTLMAAAKAYFDYFNDKSVKVPWGKPCRRLEGGLLTGKGMPDDTCDVGVPKGVPITNRHYIVDPTIGGVAAMVTFSKDHLPDVHMFRIERGEIRWIDTITVCGRPNCGFPLPKELRAESAEQTDSSD